ncbi:hypothetical protein [Magnetospirillum sp. SS-4]|uniref:hypothetical protein n=1 Tax=Magnetospirillum sp. SS-4 TaxID=2681465 RepID=UPI0013843B25|nr:hypothetical protein [Magnetospirillum sp. SS-4]CAA7621226.1 conserved hypothetical protein [Magnetospirillum sp. SS-4]
MSVSAVSSPVQPSDTLESIVPRLPSENAATANPDSSRLGMFAEGDDEPSFWDFLDVINPLQHIPIVNSVYRELTGDKIGVGARLVGGTLFGGPIGLIGAALNSVLEEATGHDAGGHLIALFKDENAPAAATAVAAAPSTPPASADATPSIGKTEDVTAARPVLLPDMPESAAGRPVADASTPGAAIAQAAATPPSVQAAVQAAPPPPAAAPVAPVAAAEHNPMPLLNSRQGRLMPLPPRTTPVATRSPPALGIAISNNSSRSNTPITGSQPSRTPVSPAMVQQMAASQAAGGSSGLSAIAGQPAAPSSSGDWFSGAMMDGLSKYERNARLGKPAPPGIISEMQ